MAYDSFKIKYLFEIYPDTDFEEEFVVSQKVEELPPSSDIQATSTKWGDVRSNIKRNRKTQSTIYRNYEVKIEVSRNIGFPILDYADYTELTTQANETFLIYDVTITQTQVPGGLNYIVLIQFKRESDELVYHNSSDNVLSYKTDESATVNEIQYDVNNPSYSFNNINIVATSITGADLAAFTLPLTDLTDTIEIGDVYYLHTDDPDFNEEQDVLNGYLDFAECYNKDADYVYLFCSDDEVNPSFDYTIPNLILDHSPDWRDLPLGVTVADKTISFVIYTFIEPIFSHESNIIQGGQTAGKEQNQKTIEKDICEFKIWLKESEKYKAEYLNLALFNEILISLKNYDDIIPGQTTGLITLNENVNLIDLFEYDIKVIYNITEVNINR
jgi:hypothetical protein